MTTVHLPSYAGWTRSQEGSFRFYVFSGFCTHRQRDFFEIPAPIRDIPTSEAVVAAQRFWPAFSAIRNLFDRHLLVLWYHAAALSSLLDQLSYPIPLAVNCFAANPDQQRYLKRLFGWFGDTPLSLDLRPADFVDGLLARCDQPLVIEDSSRSGHAAANIQILEEVLSTGAVPWNSGKEVLPLPIHAPVTIISSGASDLTCSPMVFDVDLSPENFNRDHWLSLSSLASDNQEYLAAFLSYTANHLADLQAALDLGMREAIEKSQGGLSEKCTDMYGIFIAISTFLADFFEFCSPATPPIENPLHEALLQDLFNRLEQASEKNYQTDLANIFITVARQQIQQGLLGVDYQKSCELSRKDLVVPTDTAFNFTPEAFRRVCNSIACSTPAVLNALADAGLFCGRQSNPRTAQTRVSVWDEQGIRHSIAVYSIDRSAFDQSGDPLIFDWEV